MTTQPSDWAIATAWREMTAPVIDEDGIGQVIGVGVKILEDRARELDASGDAPRAAEAGEWLPIESAPRDGSYILVCNSHGSWIAKYHPVYPSGYRPSNPWASMMLNHDHIENPGRFDHPTHWRPLPQPPAMHAPGGG